MPPIRWAAAGRSSPSAEVTSEGRAWLQLYLQKSPCTATPTSAFHCTRDGVAKHITWYVWRPDTKIGGRFCKDEDRKLTQFRFCPKAGYEGAPNFTFPEDPTEVISSSSYGYIASLFSCCAHLLSWPKTLGTGLRPYLLSQIFYHESCSWEDWLYLPCSLIPCVLLESGDTVQASVCVIYAPLCPCRLSKGAVTM